MAVESNYCSEKSATVRTGPVVIKHFSCSTQLSTKFSLLINFKLLTIANSVLLNIAEYEYFSTDKYETVNYYWHLHIYQQRKFPMGYKLFAFRLKAFSGGDWRAGKHSGIHKNCSPFVKLAENIPCVSIPLMSF